MCVCVGVRVWGGGKSRLGLSAAKHEHAGDSTSTVCVGNSMSGI